MRGACARVLAGLAAACLLVAAATAQAPHWPQTITLGTGSAGGTDNVYGAGLARILTRELNLQVLTRPSEGPAENIDLLEKGEVDLAFVTLGPAMQAWNGTGPWAGRPARSLRALFPMYDTPFQFMAFEASGIRAVADFAGKRVGVGPRGGTTAAYAPDILKALKIEATLAHGDWADLARQLAAKELDALIVGAGVPFPSFADLERQGQARYLPLTPQQVVDLRLAMPELGRSIVPAGTYPSLRREYATVGLFNFAVARQTLPDDLAYAILEAVFAAHDELIDVHSAAASTIPRNFTRNTFLPFHGGASRWYHNKSALGVERGDRRRRRRGISGRDTWRAWPDRRLRRAITAGGGSTSMSRCSARSRSASCSGISIPPPARR